MSEAARSRRDEARYEPHGIAPDRDAVQASADPLAELARLVGQDDPFRSVFRPAPAPTGHAADPRVPHHEHDAVRQDEAAWAHAEGHHAAEAAMGQGGYDDGHAAQHGYEDHYSDAAHHGDPHGGYDDRYDAAAQEALHDEAGFADGRFAADAAAASTLPDLWAHGGEDLDAAPPLDHGGAGQGPAERGGGSARRPLAVLAAVLVLTGGGLAASFLAKGPSAPGAAVAGAAGRSAPTIMAATGPTKVKVEDTGATAPEDQDAALLNRNGNVSSGPVKIVSSQEQPVDLGQLPKTSDLADGARPIPPAAPSPFPEPRKVKTFVVHPDGTMLSADGVPAPAAGASPDAVGSALPATPKTANRGGTTPSASTPKSAAPPDAIAALSAPDPAPAAAAKPPRQAAAPGVRAAAVRPNDTADAPGSGYGVQLASSPVEADATAAFAKLKKKYPSLLGALTASIHRAETGDKPVYRVRVGSMGQDDAKALCSQLQGAGGSCFVVHN